MTNETQSLLPTPGRALILLLIIVGTTFATMAYRDRASTEQTGEAYITLSDHSEPVLISNTDTDNDGLRDWEEVLWGTDPNNTDSDGDGTIDGTEVDMGRSPNIPAPGDAFDVSALSQQFTETATSSENKTQTEQFAEMFITTYLNSQVTGSSFINQIESFTDLAIPATPPPVQYTLDDITITSDTSENAAHAYGNTVGGILTANAPGVENELIIVLKALRDEDDKILAELAQTVASYQKNAEELLTIVVPENIVIQHVRLINAFISVSHDIERMALLFTDPLRALAGIDSYFDTSEELTDTLSALRTYLKNTTNFSPSEDGYALIGNE